MNKFYFCPKKRSKAEERTETNEKEMNEMDDRCFFGNGGGNGISDAADGSTRGNNCRFGG